MTTIVWLTQAQAFFISRARYRILEITPTGEGLLVTIGGQKCAVSIDPFSEWCIGPSSYCILNLGACVGSMHRLTRRYATDRQRLRHHLVV